MALTELKLFAIKTVDIGYRLLPSGIESYQRVNGRYRGIALLEDHRRLS
jgi:hypothetical protein